MATKDLYPSIRPSLNLDFANSKVLDPRITFVRASAATYYDGRTVAKAEENIYTYSQDFSNGIWVKNLSTVVSNSTTAPDGTATASKFVSSPSNGYQYITQSISSVSEGSQVVISLYAKASEYTKLQISNQSSGNLAVRFDLVTGSVVSYSGTNFVSASAVSFGSGWYRCVVVFNKVGTVLPTISGYPDNAILSSYAPSYTGDGTSGIYIWGAQLEQRSQVTAYTPTTTQPVTNYIPVLQTAPAGVPRFDHNPVTGESLGLLVEEQRTNLLTYSEQLDNAAWPKANAIIIPNSVTSPVGTLDADIFASSATAGGYYYRSVALSTGSTYTYSCYFKQFGANTSHNFYFNDSAPGQAIVAILATNGVLSIATISSSGVFSSASASITFIGNGWYRVSLTATYAGGVVPGVALASNTGRDGYSGLCVWGLQVEAGSFPTSYIKTEASQVTRAADVASMTGANFSSWYRSDEGTIAVESILRSVIGTDAYVAAISGGNIDNTIRLGHLTNGNARRLNVRANAVNTVALDIFPASVPDVVYKQSASYKVNDFATSSNGSNVAKTATGAIPYNLDKLVIGASALYVRRIAYYPKRLSDAQLVALTT